MRQGRVAIVLALSGCEAIANLTGVMHKPVYKTASKAIWVVALEVAVFNLILGLAMISIYPLSREAHKEYEKRAPVYRKYRRSTNGAFKVFSDAARALEQVRAMTGPGLRRSQSMHCLMMRLDWRISSTRTRYRS